MLWGVAFANLVRGVELDADHQYVGGFWALLNPFALLGGATTLLLFLTHGAVFLALKSDGDIRARAGAFAARSSIVTLVVAGCLGRLGAGRLLGGRGRGSPSRSPRSRSSCVVVAARGRREGLAFTASAVAIVAAVVLIFGSMYPDVMPAFDPANSLTVTNASSTHYTLVVMTWVAVILTPIVLLYQGWTYWVFRKRISTSSIPAHTGLTFDKVPAARARSRPPRGEAARPAAAAVRPLRPRLRLPHRRVRRRHGRARRLPGAAARARPRAARCTTARRSPRSGRRSRGWRSWSSRGCW